MKGNSKCTGASNTTYMVTKLMDMCYAVVHSPKEHPINLYMNIFEHVVQILKVPIHQQHLFVKFTIQVFFHSEKTGTFVAREININVFIQTIILKHMLINEPWSKSCKKNLRK
jgi:hypothetical protein